VPSSTAASWWVWRRLAPSRARLQQPVGEARVDPAEGHLVQEHHQVGETAAEVGEDQLAELCGVGEQPLEHGGSQPEPADLGLGDAFRRIGVVGDQAGGGEHAALPPLDAVEDDLVAARRDQLDPHRAGREQEIEGAGVAGPEQDGARRYRDAGRLTQHGGAGIFRQQGQQMRLVRWRHPILPVTRTRILGSRPSLAQDDRVRHLDRGRSLR
jgi:hypothetical protein